MVQFAIRERILRVNPKKARRLELGQIRTDCVERIIPKIIDWGMNDYRLIYPQITEQNLTPTWAKSDCRLGEIYPLGPMFLGFVY